MQRLLPYLLARAEETVNDDLARIYRGRYGLTRPEWRILVALIHSGPALSRDLSPLTALDKVQISRGVAPLSEKYLIDKQLAPGDGRARLLFPTPKGRALYHVIMPQVEDRVADLFCDLTESEQDELRETLRRLIQRAGQGLTS